jgi:hypothetical protein
MVIEMTMQSLMMYWARQDCTGQSPPIGGLRYPRVGSHEDVDSDVLSLRAAALAISLDKKDKSNVYLVNVLFCCLGLVP